METDPSIITNIFENKFNNFDLSEYRNFQYAYFCEVG